MRTLSTAPSDHPSIRTALGALAIAVAGAVALSGCTAPPPAQAARLEVVVTTTQLGDWTRAVVGAEPVAVHQLLQPGQSAHGFDPSAADLLALGAAELLIVNGSGLEGWLDGAIAASGFSGTVIDTGAGLGLDAEDHEGEGEDADHGHDHDHERQADEDQSAEAGHDDDHAGADHDHDHRRNPHTWTSVHLAEHQVAAIGAGLAAADPAGAAAYAAGTEAYLAKLDALDGWILQSIAAVPRAERLLVSSHDSLHWFNEEYGIVFVGAVIPGADDSAEPSAAELGELIAAIERSGAKAVFAESSLSPQAAEAVARAAGVAVFAGDRALHADSLGAAGTPGASYLGSQIHNVRMLLESWGAVAAELPAILAE